MSSSELFPREPPLSPPRFDEDMRARCEQGSLGFTSGADKEMVIQLCRDSQ